MYKSSIFFKGDVTMAKKDPAYHTDSDEYTAHQREVYHDHNDCQAGKQIKSWHRKPGDGGKLPCKDCDKLD